VKNKELAIDALYITVHCSASPITAKVDAKVIDRWHRERGFFCIGYHFVIKRDGVLEKGRPLDMAGAHVLGYNRKNIGVCLVGGVDADGKPEANYTDDQYHTLAMLLKELHENNPHAEIKGHCDYPGVTKACPCFDTRKWLVDTNVLA